MIPCLMGPLNIANADFTIQNGSITDDVIVNVDANSLFNILENLSAGANGEYQLTDAMMELMKKDDFYACPFKGFLKHFEDFDLSYH